MDNSHKLSYFYYKENNDARHYAYNGLLDYYVPQIDEIYNRWEKHFVSDYQIKPDRNKMQGYKSIGSAQRAIDTPGLNNRLMGLDIFNRGGSGFLLSETFLYESLPYHDYPEYRESGDPNNRLAYQCVWSSPYSRAGNGGFSVFYPPRRNGPSAAPDYTITPSLRVMTYREGVDDYEYVFLLENLIAQAEKKGIAAGDARQVIRDISRFFHNSVHWSQNDAWYLDLRERIAGVIVELQGKIK